MINNYLNQYDKNCQFTNSWFEDNLLNIKYGNIEMFQIYLPVYREKSYEYCNEIDKKLWLFGAENFEEMHENVKDDSNLYIVEELEKLSVNDKFTCEYDTEVVINSLKSEGYNNGRKQEKIEIAKKMLSKGSEISFISECTGLTKEELENLN